ncbi:MAG: iron-sulfur cluster repair di-iron protein [Verrucomicrobiales bacterium]
MSHQPLVVSSPGTPLADRTVGELVAEQPGRSRVFGQFRIDFCCQGGRTLREACERKGIALETVVEGLEAEAATKAATGDNPAELPPAALAEYIVETHHAFLRRELPRLHAMAERVARVHGGHTPSLVEVNEVFGELFLELDSHMRKEEEVLFPVIVAMAEGRSAAMPLDGPLACLMHEHDDAGRALARLRELTDGHRPPAEACNTYRALFAGLADLEEDLHRHIHLENQVLFPAAEALAAAESP